MESLGLLYDPFEWSYPRNMPNEGIHPGWYERSVGSMFEKRSIAGTL